MAKHARTPPPFPPRHALAPRACINSHDGCSGCLGGSGGGSGVVAWRFRFSFSAPPPAGRRCLLGMCPGVTCGGHLCHARRRPTRP